MLRLPKWQGFSTKGMVFETAKIAGAPKPFGCDGVASNRLVPPIAAIAPP
jgi:hypothetical protein